MTDIKKVAVFGAGAGEGGRSSLGHSGAILAQWGDLRYRARSPLLL